MLKPAVLLVSFVVFLHTGGIVAYAAAQPLLSKHCPSPSSAEIDPSGQQRIQVSLSAASDVTEAAKRMTSCPSACYDLEVNLSVTGSKLSTTIVVVSDPSFQCEEENRDKPEAEERGCGLAKEPEVIIVLEGTSDGAIEGKTIGPKSRCDETLLDILDTGFEKFKNWDEEGLVEQLARLGELDEPRITSAIGGEVQDELTRALAEAGVDEGTIERVRNSSGSILDALSKGDVEGATEELEGAGVEVSDSLRDEIERLTESPSSDGSSQTFAERVARDLFGNTGFTTTGSTMSNLDRAREAIAAIESRGSGDYRAVGPRTRSGNRAYGRYQVMDFNIPSWTREALGRSLTVQEFLNCPTCQDQVFNHVFSGYANRYGGYENAARVWFGGPGALNNGSRSDGYTTIDAYAARFNRNFGTAVPFGGVTTSYTGNSSPFQNLSPFSDLLSGSGSPNSGGGGIMGQLSSLFGGGLGGSSGGGSGSGGGASYVSSNGRQQQQIPVSSQILQQIPFLPTTQPSGSSQQDAPDPVATLIVQPSEISRGQTFKVSWSSIGISEGNPCSLYLLIGETNELFAQDIEFSDTVETTSQSPSGTWEFTLQCQAPSGELLERNDSIIVR